MARHKRYCSASRIDSIGNLLLIMLAHYKASPMLTEPHSLNRLSKTFNFFFNKGRRSSLRKMGTQQKGAKRGQQREAAKTRIRWKFCEYLLSAANGIQWSRTASVKYLYPASGRLCSKFPPPPLRYAVFSHRPPFSAAIITKVGCLRPSPLALFPIL